MLNNLTPNFLIAMSEDGTTPIQLIVFHFSNGDVFLADRDIIVDGQLYSGLVENWGSLATVGAENAVNSTMVMDITLWNGGNNPFTDYFLNESPVDVFVDVFQTYAGLAASDMAFIGEFVIQDPIINNEATRLVRLDLVTTNMRYFAQVGELLTKEKFPNALESDINKSIDLIVGDAGTVKCICSHKPATATLTGSFLKKPTTIEIHENTTERGFQTGGINYLQIDDEIMSYSASGEDYFIVDVRGLFGTNASDHSDGSEIIQANTHNDYIIGQGELSEVTDIRVKGQVPSIPYELLLNQNPALIRFNSQPTYIEYSKGARSIDEDFDSTADDNTADHPSWAYDIENKSLGAILNSTARKLSIFQNDAPIDEGEIVGLFLRVDHWATKAYNSDLVNVVVDGVGSLGMLNRPNSQDIIDVGGEVDIYHGHEHDTAVSHTHNSDDPDFDTNTINHLHAIDNSETGVDGTITTAEQKILTVDINKNYHHYSPYKTGHTQTYVEFYISTYLGDPYKQAITIAGTKVYAIDRLVLKTGWTSDPSTIIVQANGAGSSGDYIKYKIQKIVVFSSAANTDYTRLYPTTYKSASGNVTELEQNTNVIKAVDDVQNISAAERLKQLQMTLQENSSRTVTQRFDVTRLLETVDWQWIVGRKVYLEYVGGAETPNIVVTYINFEIEHRQREVKSTDEVTCKPVGIIENRPDAVIQYLLTEKAGLPLEKLSSVYRNVPVWDDTHIWDDTEIWHDEGQVANVPDGAAFEEAAAWFALRNYEIDGIILGNLSVKDAIEKITFQSRSKLLWQNAETKLVVLRKTEDWLTVRDIGIEDIQLKSYSSKRSLVKDIVNKIDLFHTIDRLSDAADSGKYDSTSYVSDAKSILKHGERKKEDLWLFDLIRKQGIADDLADYYLWELGETTTYYSFRTYLKNYDIEKEDYIKISSAKFEKLNQAAVVIKELVREFGIGKLGKINTLNIISQAIRRIIYFENINDQFTVSDNLGLEIGRLVDLADEAVIFENLLINQGYEPDDITIMTDVFSILARYNSALQDITIMTDSISGSMTVSLEDAFSVDDELFVTDRLCFGACGFGAPNCELPFGAVTRIEGATIDYTNTTDQLELLLSMHFDDSIAVTDAIAFYDGFGCKLGDGLGITPFGF